MTLNELIGQIKASLKKVAVAVFQLKNQQGELNELQTTHKTSLVGAINEVAITVVSVITILIHKAI